MIQLACDSPVVLPAWPENIVIAWNWLSALVSPNILISPRQKVERAYRHIDELRSLTDPLSREFYTIEVVAETIPPQAEPSWYDLEYRPLKPIPETLALVIGDVVHNLRSALDHIATGIARTADSKATIHYPMSKNRQDLAPPRSPAREKAFSAMEKALPGTEKLILDKIRPLDGPNESAWAFHVLNNDDKHNLLIPLVTFAAFEGMRFRNHTKLGVGNNAAHPFILIRSHTPISIEGNFQASVDLRFGDIDVFKFEPVIPTLVLIAQVVGEAIEEFAQLMES